MAGRQEETPHPRPKEKISLNSSATRVTFLHLLAGYIGAAYLHFVAKTSFLILLDHPRVLPLRREKKPLLYTFWHNAQVFLTYAHRGEGINVLVSRSQDGEYIVQVLTRLGLKTVRGSKSKGGEQALRDLCDLLENGKQTGFTPDGPRGPVQTVHGGVVVAAQRSGAPIVPMTTVSRRRIVFNSWDKFVLPLPFSTIVVAHNAPVYLPKELSLEEAKEKVRFALNKVVADAERVLAEAPSWGVSLSGAILHGLYTAVATLLLPLSLPFLMMRYGAGRTFKFLGERFSTDLTPSVNGKRVWFHAASVGEWRALRPILTELELNPAIEFLVTVSTPEARVLAAKEEPGMAIRMVPLDLPWIMRPWISRVAPEAAVVVETELWPNMIGVLEEKRIPIFIVNGRLSTRSVKRWKFIKPFIQRSLRRLSGVFARTELDGQRYFQLGALLDRITVAGNTKYDNLAVSDETTKKSRREEKFRSSEGIWIVAGSTWNGEEAAVLQLFQKKIEGPRLRLILAPRYKDRFAAVAKMLEGVPASWSYLSKVKSTREWDTDILLVDTFGDLKDLYALADIAFVGGSLTMRGGQNPLEAAAAGIPVLFGPSMENFHEEAAALKRVGAARQARHAADVQSDIRELATDENSRRLMGAAARRFVEEKQGASRRIAAGLQEAIGL